MQVLQRKNKVAHSAQNASYFEDRRDEAQTKKSGGYLEVDKGVAEAARALLEGESDGAMTRVVVSPEETIKVDGSAASVSGVLPAGSRTCFVLARRSSGALFLFLLCTEEAKIRERMVYACATQSLQDNLRASGLDFESVSVSSASEVADALGLSDKAKSEREDDVGGKTFSRPKRPGRGKRGLIKKLT